MAAPQASSRLEMLQARFQQRQLLEKEQKLLQLYDQQQLRAHQVAQRGSAGSNGSNSSGGGNTGTVSHHQTVTRTTTNTHSNANSQPGGKVRQMFDERRQTTVKGIDKSYPLEPLDNRSRKQQTTTTTSNVVVSSTLPMKNGNPMSNRQSLVVRRTMRSEANSNVNGGKPIVSYREEVSREIGDPTDRDNDNEEFGDDEDPESRYGNGNRHVDRQTEVQIEDVTNENSTQRHRTTAKIHLSDFNSGNEANRFDDNSEKLEFPDDPATDATERLPKRAPTTKKPSQTEPRLERLKNSNVKRIPHANKQVAGNTTSYTKKRTETSVNSGSTFRTSESTRTTKDEITRARSTTPEVVPPIVSRVTTEKPRKSTSPTIVDRTSIVPKISCVSKVSQLAHNNSMDFYPRRKSEFEKSKTFRKLQLELGESSPEPIEPNDDDSTIEYVKHCRKRSSIINENIYKNERRSSSSSPIDDRRNSTGRRRSPDESTKFSQYDCVKEKSSNAKNERETSNYQSHTSSSRRRSSSLSPTGDRDTFQERRRDRDESPDRSKRPEECQSPFDDRRTSDFKEETETTNFQSQTYSSRRRSSSSNYVNDRETLEERENNREISPKPWRTRNPSDGSINVKKSTIETRETRTIGDERGSTNLETNRRSSSRRSSSTRPNSREYEERTVDEERSPDVRKFRRDPESPLNRRKSTTKNDEIHVTSREVKTTDHSSRRRSSSASPMAARNSDVERGSSRETSPELPRSRRGSQNPISELRSRGASRESETKRSEIRTTSSKDRGTSPIVGKTTSGRSDSPRRDVRRSSGDRRDDRMSVDERGTSGETLRSVELVKKLARSRTPEKKTTRPTSDGKTTLEDVEFRRSVSRRRSESPTHKIVKKDKAVQGITKNRETTGYYNDEKINNQTRDRNLSSRSRTTSPSSPTSTSMMETASFRAKKAERKNSSETTRCETKRMNRDETKIREIDRTNLFDGKSRNCDVNGADRRASSTSDDKDRSRKSSAEITVKRHDTFKVVKPREKIMKIERESSIDDDNDESTIVTDSKDKNRLFERIEKIRTTLSKSGRSERNLEEPKDFERTDSVESALKRFDSIGVETEHRVTVGVDEIDRSSKSPSPDVISSSAKEIFHDTDVGTKKSVVTRDKSTKTSVAVVKAQPRRIDAKIRDLNNQKNLRVNLGRKTSDNGKSVRANREKIVAQTTPRQSTKTRSNQKIAASIVRNSKLRRRESSGRGEETSIDRSPECKRRLFDDSESEIDTDNSRSTVVMSTTTTRTVARSPMTIGIETKNNRDDVTIGNENMTRSVSSLRDRGSDNEQSTKVLRSIEDIRQSIKRESQDFKRELNKFNVAMRKDEESSLSVSPDRIVTSGIASCVKITKTLNPGDVDAVIKIERSIVKLPINRRVAKSPSPDIGVKRSTDVRARTPTGSVRRTVAPSPAKIPDAHNRYGSAESKTPGAKLSSRISPSPSTAREDRMRAEFSKTIEQTDCIDGSSENSKVTTTEIVATTTTESNDDFVVDNFDDDDVVFQNNEIASSNLAKPLHRKQSNEKLGTSQKQNKSSSIASISRPASALSTSSAGSARGQISQINTKTKMSTKTKISSSSPQKGPSVNVKSNNDSAVNDGLAACKICGRRFNSDRVSLHEQICSKTATKKRKQFDATVHRVKGTELEPFVVKKGVAKKTQNDRKTSKPEVKSNWRRKHEDFINAIRSAKQVQAHLAAGGKLSDLPPPPASDTSDYIQCPHCGRKFNQSAADRHIPKCQSMMHNKPNPRAPPKPKR